MTWVAFASGLVLGFPAGVILAGALAASARSEAEDVAEVRGFRRGWHERARLARIDRDLADEVRRVRAKDEGKRLLEEIADAVPEHEWAELNFHL